MSPTTIALIGALLLVDSSAGAQPAGQPEALRRQALVLATLMSLMLLGAALLPRRRRVAAIFVCILFSAILIGWGASRP